MGNLYKNPEQPLTPAAFRLVRVEMVGTYAVQPVWADGHATGIYSRGFIRSITSGERRRSATKIHSPTEPGLPWPRNSRNR